MRTVLVTGATGFIGQALCAALHRAGKSVRVVTRRPALLAAGRPGIDGVIRADLGAAVDWRAALQDVDCVVHLAARTHVMHDTAADPLAEYRRINVDATRRAGAGGSGRRRTAIRFCKFDQSERRSHHVARHSARWIAPRPEDAYGVLEMGSANRRCGEIAAASKLETVVLRPPLLYGPGVKGNFLRLMRAIERGMPLPLGVDSTISAA